MSLFPLHCRVVYPLFLNPLPSTSDAEMERILSETAEIVIALGKPSPAWMRGYGIREQMLLVGDVPLVFSSLDDAKAHLEKAQIFFDSLLKAYEEKGFSSAVVLRAGSVDLIPNLEGFKKKVDASLFRSPEEERAIARETGELMKMGYSLLPPEKLPDAH